MSDLDRDLVVLGGGVTGLAIARLAARAGWPVTLAERDDLAAGASSTSSHMLHGGLRYLEHGRFTLDCVNDVRARVPGVNVLVHPECRHEVVTAADEVGSTEYIIRTIEAAPAGSAWAVGTELNLVRRLANAHPDKQIMFLERTVCYCSTMNRIDLPHLVWALEELVAGRVVNEIRVDERTAHDARVALDQMLALP